MKSKKSTKSSPKPKKLSKPSAGSKEKIEGIAKLSLFDHVKHIRGEQSPTYYDDLSEENRKTFNHFMLLRALAMDSEVVQEMAFLYRYFHLIPSPQFYKLLIALVPRSTRWVPWIKTKVVKHSPEVLTAISNHYKVSKRQANEYINVLLASDDGKERLADLCRSVGLRDKETENLVNTENEE